MNTQQHELWNRRAGFDTPLPAVARPENALSVSQQTAYLLSGAHSELIGADEVLRSLRETLPGTLRQAFAEKDPVALLEVQRSLYAIYELSFGNPLAAAVQHEHAPWVTELRAAIERSWEAFEMEQVAPHIPPSGVQSSFPELRDWFVEQSCQISPTDRKVVTYLAEQATLDEFKLFLLVDANLNYRFYDAMALASLHYSETVKAEICKHIWEECGEGDPGKFHTRLFTRALASLDLNLPSIPIWEDWRPYAGFNLYFLFGLNRRHYFKALGSLAMPELFDPDRDTAVVEGCRRLGLNAEHDFAYYCVHVEGDQEHGDTWLDFVIRPVVENQPEAALEVALGAAMRMEAMRRFNLLLCDLFGLGADS